jgi:hypothetical protein
MIMENVMTKAGNKSIKKLVDRLRTQPVEFGFVTTQQEAPEEQPSETPTPRTQAQGASMKEIDRLRSQIDSDLTHAEYLRNGWLTPGRVRDETQEIDAAMTEAFSDGNYPKGYNAVREKLKPIYDRKGWGEVPGRNVVRHAKDRLRKRR